MNFIRPSLFAQPVSSLLLAALATSFAARAADSTPTGKTSGTGATNEPIQLKTTVVTGSPLERTLFDLATPASVLKDRELAVRLQSTLGETINTLPGVTSTSYGPNAMARGVNLLDEEARNHVSFLKDIAPLGGRGATVSLRASF